MSTWCSGILVYVLANVNILRYQSYYSRHILCRDIYSGGLSSSITLALAVSSTMSLLLLEDFSKFESTATYPLLYQHLLWSSFSASFCQRFILKWGGDSLASLALAYLCLWMLCKSMWWHGEEQKLCLFDCVLGAWRALNYFPPCSHVHCCWQLIRRCWALPDLLGYVLSVCNEVQPPWLGGAVSPLLIHLFSWFLKQSTVSRVNCGLRIYLI